MPTQIYRTLIYINVLHHTTPNQFVSFFKLINIQIQLNWNEINYTYKVTTPNVGLKVQFYFKNVRNCVNTL